MSTTLTQNEESIKELLSIAQSSFPLNRDPYGVLAEQLHSTPEEVFAVMNDAWEQGLIRRVGPIFDSYHLGYVSTLCAMKVPSDRVEEIAEFINGYVNVTHNYLRENDYNLWFTVIACGDGELNRILGEIESFSGATVLPLPALRLFKIKADFNLTGEKRAQAAAKTTIPREVKSVSLTDEDKLLIRTIQQSSWRERYPFDAVAEHMSQALAREYTPEQVLEKLQTWKDQGAVRRFGVTVRHRKVGMRANVMVVWDVDDAAVEQAGTLMATFDEVSHCYQRPRFPDWPSNLYTMIHGKTREACDAAIESIQQALHEAGITVASPQKLFTLKELKKTSMQYFCEEC